MGGEGRQAWCRSDSVKDVITALLSSAEQAVWGMPSSLACLARIAPVLGKSPAMWHRQNLQCDHHQQALPCLESCSVQKLC